MSRAINGTVLALITMGCVTTVQSATSPAEGQSKNLPYCDEIKEAPAGEYACEARAVSKPIPQNKEQENKAFLPSSEGKKAITPEAYERWKRIDAPTLSGDGRWVAYTLTSSLGEGDLIVRATQGASEWRVSRGFLPAHLSTHYRAPKLRKAPQFAADSRFLIFTSEPVRSTTKTMGVAIKKDARGSHNPLVCIMQLADGSVTCISNVSSFVLPKRSGRYFAYLREDDAATATASDSNRAQAPVGSTLVLMDLITGQRIQVSDVVGFELDDRANYLAYTGSSKARYGSGAYVRELSTGKVFRLAGPGVYRSLTFDHSGEQVAFLSNSHEGDDAPAQYALHYANLPASSAEEVVTPAHLSGLRISPNAGIKFTRSGNALVFRVEPVLAKSGNASNEPPAKGARFELWRSKDSRISLGGNPEADYRRSYLAVYHIGARRWVQLESASLPDVLLSGDARHALGINQNPYLIQEDWGERTADLYIVDVLSGETRLLRRAFHTSLAWKYAFTFSPSGRYLMYFENRRWFSYDFDRARLSDLTGALLPQIHFDYTSNNLVNRPPRPVGIAAWTADEKRVLIYDPRDIWEIDPAGVEMPRNLTDGIGAKENIVFRLWNRDPAELLRHKHEENPLLSDASKPLLLTARDRDTMASGIWQDRIGASTTPEPLIMSNQKITLLAKANRGSSAGSSQYLLTQETFREFPDLWTGSRLDQLTRLSNANPQQQEYRWGSVELVEWTSSFGVPLKGLLFKPDDFDPKKKYPMIVSIYSGVSSGLHHYFAPQLSTALSISPAVFLSKGNIFFMPDIINATPYPGETALAAVTTGVQSVIERGFVDRSRLALMGHSWGGYETAYIVTRTDLFRCAVAASGMSNTISAYSSIMENRTFSTYMYEHGIMYHGRSVWEAPLVYLSNSPLMFADRIRTPLLMMHNEKDDTVPFSQGVDLFVALRRNRKEAYLFNYKNEGHELLQYENQLHWEHRVRQFLDYFLQDASKPDWMINEVAPLSKIASD